jgi:hypothetical protein
LSTPPRVDARGGDAETGEPGVGEREHLTLRRAYAAEMQPLMATQKVSVGTLNPTCRNPNQSNAWCRLADINATRFAERILWKICRDCRINPL